MKKFKSGFTLIELLVVIAIIGILSSVVLASLNSARAKGSDAAVKAGLANMRAQAELYYDSNSQKYTGVCSNTQFSSMHYSAVVNGGGTATSSLCDASDTAWSAVAPLKSTAGQAWCVGSSGASKQIAGTFGPAPLTPVTDATCN
jgi:prepilin-type N-terminal cleavage/methylation domain-containing protein